jgi:ribonuclease PH
MTANIQTRIDGRAPAQMRPVTIEPDFLKTAEGSALISVGNTRVLCAATVEESVPPFLRNTGQGWVTAEYSMLPRATVTRTAREVKKGRESGRTLEIQRLIGRSLRAVVDLKTLGERSIIVDCDVLQADGGTRTAAITGAFVALGMALNRMKASEMIGECPLKAYVAATSVGMIKGVPMLDLCYEEDSAAEVDMNIIRSSKGKFIELQATAEREDFGDDDLAQLLALGRAGVEDLIALQKEFVQVA